MFKISTLSENKSENTLQKKQITKVHNKERFFLWENQIRANKPVNTFRPSKIKRRKVYFKFYLCQRQAKFGHTVRDTCRQMTWVPKNTGPACHTLRVKN
jgi:hypothetical protein